METSLWEPCLTSQAATICLRSAASASCPANRSRCKQLRWTVFEFAVTVAYRLLGCNLPGYQHRCDQRRCYRWFQCIDRVSPVILSCLFSQHNAETNQSDHCLCRQIKEQTGLDFILVAATECIKYVHMCLKNVENHLQITNKRQKRPDKRTTEPWFSHCINLHDEAQFYFILYQNEPYQHNITWNKKCLKTKFELWDLSTIKAKYWSLCLQGPSG